MTLLGHLQQAAPSPPLRSARHPPCTPASSSRMRGKVQLTRDSVLLRVAVHLKRFIFGNASGRLNYSLELTGHLSTRNGCSRDRGWETSSGNTFISKHSSKPKHTAQPNKNEDLSKTPPANPLGVCLLCGHRWHRGARPCCLQTRRCSLCRGIATGQALCCSPLHPHPITPTNLPGLCLGFWYQSETSFPGAVQTKGARWLLVDDSIPLQPPSSPRETLLTLGTVL